MQNFLQNAISQFYQTLGTQTPRKWKYNYDLTSCCNVTCGGSFCFLHQAKVSLATSLGSAWSGQRKSAISSLNRCGSKQEVSKGSAAQTPSYFTTTVYSRVQRSCYNLGETNTTESFTRSKNSMDRVHIEQQKAPQRSLLEICGELLPFKWGYNLILITSKGQKCYRKESQLSF